MTSQVALTDDAGLPEDGDFVVLGTSDAEGYRGVELQQLDNKEINRILKWLSPTDYAAASSEYGKHLQSHLAGTGNWVFETGQYQQWHEGNSGSLWIKAIAGAGKSVLAANITSKITAEDQDKDTPVLYFFFRHIITANQKPQSLVRDYMAQLLPRSPALQHNLRKFVDANRSLDSISFDELWNILVSALTLLSRVYCVVDALDEMDENEAFLRDLVRLGKKKPNSIKILLTSRPIPRVEGTLRHPSVSQIMLAQKSVDPDIAFYVKHRLQTEFNMVSDGVRERIYETMCSRANGHFLYARLMMDNLQDPANNYTADESSMLQALDELPTPMADMYTRMLLDHSRRSGVSQTLQILLLTWVTRAERPLRLLELANVVSLEKLATGKDAKSVVREGCGPLLEIFEDETVCPIHHSLTEYLYDESRKVTICDESLKEERIDPIHFPVLDYKLCQQSMALSCLKFLVSGWHNDWVQHDPEAENPRSHRDHDSRRRASKLKYPFLDYAANQWSRHVFKYDRIDDSVVIALDNLLTRDINIIKAIEKFLRRGRYWSVDGSSYRDKNIKPSIENKAVLMAARTGISHYLQHLVNRGYDIDCRDESQHTPLALAATCGYTEAVAVLLNAGAKTDEDDNCGHKPLHHAAMRNYYQIVKLLLEAGVSCLTPKTKENPGRRCGNAPRTVGTTPCSYACDHGHVETIQEMIPYLSQKDIHNALGRAIYMKRTKVAKTLLKTPGIDINKKHGNKSLLYLAAHALDTEIIRELLERGADVDILSDNNFDNNRGYWGRVTPESTYNPLQAFATSCGRERRSMEDLKAGFSYLLDANLDLNARDDSGATVLHRLLQRDRYSTDNWGWLLEILKFLVGQGLDVSSRRTSDGSSALHLIPSLSPELIDWFINQGLDVNEARISDGKTPLMTVAEMSNAEEAAKLLISRGANVNIADKDGQTVLHYQCKSHFGHNGLTKTVLSAGADVNARNNDGKSPFFSREHFEEEELQIWLDHGLDLNQKDKYGNNVLFDLILRRPDIEKFKALIRAGADAKTSNSGGSTVLHLILSNMSSSVREETSIFLRYFVNEGISPLSLDRTGNNLWHIMASLGAVYQQEEQLATMHLLKEFKVPPNAKNYLGQTPLQLSFSVTRGYYPYGPTEFLLEECNADVNAADLDGVRAIHLTTTFDLSSTCRLIELNADPMAVTKEGQNCLMIGCRTRNSNTVSRILDYLSQTGQANSINSKDTQGRTALHYACKSGRPESVELLLLAGADVNVEDRMGMTPLHLCGEYQQEENLWKFINSNKRKSLSRVGAGYVLSDDMTRPTQDQDSTNMIRIRETIRLLIDFGADISFLNSPSRWSTLNYREKANPLEKALNANCEPMVSELLRIQETLSEAPDLDSDEKSELATIHTTGGQIQTQKTSCTKVLKGFHHRSKMLRIQFMPQIIRESINEAKGYNRELISKQIVEDSLKHDDEVSVEQLSETGIDFVKTDQNAYNHISKIAYGGFTGLMRKTGQGAAKMSASWVNEMAGEDSYKKQKFKTILHVALSRNLPNMGIVKFLVEDLKVDINEQIDGDQLIHKLVGFEMKCSWWHTKALGYLIAHGWNIECLNRRGDTPLITSLRGTENYVKIRMVEILLEHGANPNAVDALGLTCLNIASKNNKSIMLLLNHGASPSIGRHPFIFDAIKSQSIDVLRNVMQSGIDLNVLPLSPEDPQIKNNKNTYAEVQNPEALYPLEEAAKGLTSNNLRTSANAIEICKLLLDAGADICAQHKDGSIVLHRLLREKGMLDLFLTHQAFDIECRDGKGRTPILAACDFHIQDINYGRNEITPKQRSIVVSTLLEHEASLEVADNSGRNVLHCLLSTPFKYINFRSTNDPTSGRWNLASRILKHALKFELPSKADAEGRTPLHYVLRSLQLSFVDLLLSYGADPLLVDPTNGYTALHYIVQALAWNTGVSCGKTQSGILENLNSETPELKSPEDHFTNFIQHGVDVNTEDIHGDTPLLKLLDHHDSLDGYAHIVKALKYLKSKGAELGARSRSGESILHKLATLRTRASDPIYDRLKDEILKEERNLQRAFEWLVEKGVDVTWEDNKSRTCLDVAAAVGATWALDLYKRKGSEISG